MHAFGLRRLCGKLLPSGEGKQSARAMGKKWPSERGGKKAEAVAGPKRPTLVASPLVMGGDSMGVY